MRHKKIFVQNFWCFSFILLLMNSCNKNEFKEINTNQVGSIMYTSYFIDNNEVSESEFASLESNYLFIDAYKDEYTIEKRAFSNDESYIQFGQDYGYSFDKQLAFERVMSDYAEKSGAIYEY